MRTAHWLVLCFAVAIGTIFSLKDAMLPRVGSSNRLQASASAAPAGAVAQRHISPARASPARLVSPTRAPHQDGQALVAPSPLSASRLRDASSSTDRLAVLASAHAPKAVAALALDPTPRTSDLLGELWQGDGAWVQRRNMLNSNVPCVAGWLAAEYIQAGPLLAQCAISAEDVARDADRWLALGRQLAEQLKFDFDNLDATQK